MERIVGTWVVAVLVAGLIAAATGGDPSEAVDAAGTSTSSTVPAAVGGGPLPPTAPAALPEGARVNGEIFTPETVVPTTAAPSTTEPVVETTVAPSAPTWPRLSDSGVGVVVTPTGVVAAVEQVNDDGSFVVMSPCGNSVEVTGTPVRGAHVVLDPGHGGSEPGAVGPMGLREKDVNLAVTAAAVERLEAGGATVVVTRTGDYRVTVESRAAIANALSPLAYISIHHNADPDGPFDGPGSETFYQVSSDSSRRLAGLLVEEYRRAFSTFDIEWVGDTDAGAKYRTGSDGDDYYGVLRRTSGVTSVLSEAAYVTNPPEERLLLDPDFHRIEADAIGQALERHVFTEDPGSGFTEPYPRDEPAGGGGGSEGCVDPPMG